MGKINVGRVLLGGLVGGLVLNIVDFVVSGLLLKEPFEAATKALNPGLNAMSSSAITGYVVADFISGLLIAFLYAAMRPRFGSGPKTGAIAGLVIWAAIAGLSLTFVCGGIYPGDLILKSLAGTLIGTIAAGYASGMLYQES